MSITSSQKIYVGMDPSDFLSKTYDTYGFGGATFTPSCSNTVLDTTTFSTCTDGTSKTNATLLTDCYNKEYCNNKLLYNQLAALNTKNNILDERLQNKKFEYKSSYIHSVNLGVGILFLFVLLLKTNQKK